MSDKISLGGTFRLLENAMHVAHQRHSLLSSNISNVETPGYKARNIDFKSAMDRAIHTAGDVRLAKTDAGHMTLQSGAFPAVEVFEEKSEWNGYNWMNIEQMMTQLTENSLIYRTATEALLRKISLMKEVIREGGR